MKVASIIRVACTVCLLLIVSTGVVALPDAAELEDVMFYGDRAEFTGSNESTGLYKTQIIEGGAVDGLHVNASLPENTTGSLLYERSGDGFESYTVRNRIDVLDGSEVYVLPADQRGDVYRFTVELPGNSTLHELGTERGRSSIFDRGSSSSDSSESGDRGPLFWLSVAALVCVGMMWGHRVWGDRKRNGNVFEAAQAHSQRGSYGGDSSAVDTERREQADDATDEVQGCADGCSRCGCSGLCSEEP